MNHTSLKKASLGVMPKVTMVHVLVNTKLHQLHALQ